MPTLPPELTPRGLRNLPAGSHMITVEFTSRPSPLKVVTVENPDGVDVKARHGFVAAAVTPDHREQPPRSIDPFDSKAHFLADLLITAALLPEPNWLQDGSDPLTVAEALGEAAACLDEGAWALDERLRVGVDIDDRLKVARALVVLDNGEKTKVHELRWRSGSPLIEFPDGDRLTVWGHNARIRLSEKLAMIAGEHFQNILPIIPDEEPRLT